MLIEKYKTRNYADILIQAEGSRMKSTLKILNILLTGVINSLTENHFGL